MVNAEKSIILASGRSSVMIPLALGGFLSVALTVLVHESSELLAVVNGLRARRSA
ncbi:MAG: hypothetical protein ACYC1T_14280 [Sulfuricaulis sp.]